MKKATIRDAQDRMLEILIEVDRICKKHNINYWLDAGTLLGAIRHNGFIPWDDDLDIGMLREDYNRFLKVINEELEERYYCESPDNCKCNNAFVKIRDKHSRIINKGDNDKGIFIDVFPYDSFTRKNMLTKQIFNSITLCEWFSKLNFKKPFLRNFKKNIVIFICKLFNLVTILIPFTKINKFMYNKAKKVNIVKSEKISYGIEVPFKESIYIKDVFPLVMHDFEGLEFPVPHNYKNVLRSFFGEWNQLPPIEQRTPSHSEDILISK